MTKRVRLLDSLPANFVPMDGKRLALEGYDADDDDAVEFLQSAAAEGRLVSHLTQEAAAAVVSGLTGIEVRVGHSPAPSPWECGDDFVLVSFRLAEGGLEVRWATLDTED